MNRTDRIGLTRYEISLCKIEFQGFRIGLTKIPENQYEITPCEIQFEGFSITVGEGIKRAFSRINTEFSSPCNKYIEQFFICEMQSVCQFSEDPREFLHNFNKVLSKKIQLLQLKKYCESNEKEFDESKALDQAIEISSNLHPFLNKVDVIGQANLSNEVKCKVIGRVHGTILDFIDDLLRATNQMNSTDSAIRSKICEESGYPELQSRKETNNTWRNLLVCLGAIVIGLLVCFFDLVDFFDLKQAVFNNMARA